MKDNQKIENALENFKENELIFASRLYKEQLREEVKEPTFYKTLERMCNEKKLYKIAKGTYYIPKKSKYGIVPVSDKEIIQAFTENNTGTVVGYALYNSLNITTQISKSVNVFSSNLEGQTKMIRNISVRNIPLQYSDKVKKMIHALEIFQNFNSIEDINYKAFLNFCEGFSQEYSNEVFEKVISKIKYQKCTISFMQEVLNYHGVPNTLNKYLSGLSIYKHPKMEELYETARVY